MPRQALCLYVSAEPCLKHQTGNDSYLISWGTRGQRNATGESQTPLAASTGDAALNPTLGRRLSPAEGLPGAASPGSQLRRWRYWTAVMENSCGQQGHLVQKLLLAGHKLHIRIWLVWKIPFFVVLELYAGVLRKTPIWVWVCTFLLSLSWSRLDQSLLLNPDQATKSKEPGSQFICACVKLKQRYWLCWYFSETRFWPPHNQFFTFFWREQLFLFSFFPLSK